MKYISYLVILFLFPLHLLAGDEAGHGGDTYTDEFFALGMELYYEMKKAEYNQLISETKVDTEKFRTSILKTLLDSAERDKVKLNGQEKSAINSVRDKDKIKSKRKMILDKEGEPKFTADILLNRTRWRASLLADKLQLVLHEFFGILGIERDTYDVSYYYRGLLAKLTMQLLASRITPVMYYGYAVASKSLHMGGAPCDRDYPAIQDATKQAEELAMDRCIAEREEGCRNLHVEYQTIQSDEHIAFRYCEITALAK